jgi:pimeloyl-ACP methyl ester carboxylesterase
VRDILLLGQSIGCLVACQTALERPDVAGLVLLAPASGRRLLRELAAWSAMLAQAEGQNVNNEDGGLAIAGFVLPANFAADIKLFDVRKRPAHWALLVEASERVDKAFGDRLIELGVETQRLPFDGLDQFIGDPTTSRVPQKTYAELVALLRARYDTKNKGTAPRRLAPAHCGELATKAFAEEAITFGSRSPLFGLLCKPAAKASQDSSKAAVLILNTGRNAHIGWGRMSVDHARALAAAGIGSLRIDIAGVGESPARDDRPAQFLYTNAPVEDVVAAIDVLSERGFTAITLVGVCSGAYLGLLAALADRRVTSLVAVNLPRFSWGRSESIEAAIRFVNRPNSQSLRRIFDLRTLRHIATGRLDPRPALKFRSKSAIRRIGLRLAPFIGPLSPGWPIRHEACKRLATLSSRRTNVFLGYVATDEGAAELNLLFGKDGRRLRQYPNVSLGFIENSDHNLSQADARDWLLECIFATLAKSDS